ncbi:HFX_2341 family transcriptional regulator domain-containing protein [Haloarcula halophila]|uniref:HFX_2341 family transcriptional regulator domain-containing protein n=1 Tax=Haloarcula TaxID=2237 RepID=UPI0023E44047|nr:DUF6293 family protein [Halomicroarcula sp. DFY41]
MTERVHFLPVGFDFDRLILPISKGQMEADRVVLVTHDIENNDDPSRAAELASRLTDRLENSFDLFDVEVERETLEVEKLYQYELLYPEAHDYILNEIVEGNDVYVNISSMPRTTAFAFATAADSIITEYQKEVEEIRNKLHTYYVPPDNYLVLDMIEALEDARDWMKGQESLDVYPQYQNICEILEKVEDGGVTEGAKDMDGQMYVEFPSSPGSDVDDFEKKILNFLRGRDSISSTSSLAEKLAQSLDVEYDESFRSRVQYNVTKLDEKGYVDREKEGNRLETELSTMGRMWVETN